QADVEGLSQDQPRQHSHQSVSRDRRRRDAQLQPAPRRMPDAHSAEALVPEVRARSPEHRHRQGLRVRQGTLRRRRGGGSAEGPCGVDASDRAREVHGRYGHRPDLSGAAVLSGARRPGGEGRVRRDSRRHEGHGRHRQGRALRPRVPREGAAARKGTRHVHAAPRRGNPQHGGDRRARRHAGDREARGSEAGQTGDGDLRGRSQPRHLQGRIPGRPPRDHRREDRGTRDRRARSGGAAESREPDGSAAQEPRLDRRRQEEDDGVGLADGAAAEETSTRMKHIVLAAVALTVASLAAAQTAPARPVTAEDYFLVDTVSDPHFSPDGSTIAFVITTVDHKQNRRRGEIWSVPADGSRAPTALTTAPQSSTSPRWSPDGTTIAFLSARQAAGESGDALRTQVWLLPLSGGEPHRLTSLANGVSSFAWSPDGTRLLVVSRSGPSDTAKSPSDVRHYAHANYKFNDTGWFDDKKTHVWVVDVPSGRAHQITSGDDWNDTDPQWSPD